MHVSHHLITVSALLLIIYSCVTLLVSLSFLSFTCLPPATIEESIRCQSFHSRRKFLAELIVCRKRHNPMASERFLSTSIASGNFGLSLFTSSGCSPRSPRNEDKGSKYVVKGDAYFLFSDPLVLLLHISF